MSKTRNDTRNVVVYLVKLAVAAAILLYIFNKVGLHNIFDRMTRARFPWLVVAFLAAVVMQISAAVRLHALITPHAIGLTRIKTFFINISSVFYGLFLPVGNVTGLAVRFYKLVRSEERYSWAVAALLADRITATFTLCLVGVVMRIGDGSVSSAEAFLGLIIGLAVSTVLVILIFSRKALAFIPRFEHVTRLNRVKAAVQKINETVTAYHRLPIRDLSMIFLYSVAAHLSGVLAYYSIAQSMDLGLSFMTLGWMRSVLILITMFPVTFSGLGLREVTAIVLLGSLGVSQGQAVAYSLLVFAITILSIALLGGGHDGIQWMRQASHKKV